jgi:hypothetical protein
MATCESSSKDALLKQITADIDLDYRMGIVNNVTDICLTFASVCASLAATVTIAWTAKTTAVNVQSIWANPNLWAAIFAAVPAGCTSLQRIVDFRKRSHWYFNHAAQLKSLAFELEFSNNPNLAAFAKRRGQIELAGDVLWQSIGETLAVPPENPGGQPPRTRPRS